MENSGLRHRQQTVQSIVIINTKQYQLISD